jgi:hypothetical protein
MLAPWYAWPTGVTILTSRLHNYSHGMTVNSFSSVAQTRAGAGQHRKQRAHTR